LDEVPTPAAIVDLPALERNVARMAAQTRGPSRLRPHFKTHKSIELARRQLAAGAIGITAATVWEALALAESGTPDVLIANEVIGTAKVAAAAAAARSCRLTVAVDDMRGVRELARAAVDGGVTIGALIDVDIGMGRCGVRSDGQAFELADEIARLQGLELRGVMGYEGHCVFEADPRARAAAARAATDRLLNVAELLRRAGHSVEVVSSGGTGTAAMTGSDPRVTEIQAGSYVFMDTAYERVVPEFEVALTILATVLSRHGETAVLDCGVKTIAASLGLPRLRDGEGTARYVAEEHLVLDVPSPSHIQVGDRIHVISGHCCETVNLHDRLFAVRDDRVVETWTTMGRGPGGWTM
jgi:D-serine deaminase-like pyridoxal phosphate-dependent protein